MLSQDDQGGCCGDYRISKYLPELSKDRVIFVGRYLMQIPDASERVLYAD
jgi:hypothetical protein